MEATERGISVARPAKVSQARPLPMPRRVICSLSQIRNIVPPVSVTVVESRNSPAGSLTKFGMFRSPDAIPNAWN